MKHLPNLITLGNILFGAMATVFAVMNALEWTAFFFLLGVICDFFDGLLARALGVQSELGVQLDSLADMITSGLVPGLVMCQLLSMSLSGGWNSGNFFSEALSSAAWVNAWLPFSGLLITLASGWRLARFNIDENQVSSFIGLPTPANALFIISLPLILMHNGSDFTNTVILNPWVLFGITIGSAYMLNSRVILFALKFKGWGFRENAQKYLFLIISGIMVITLQYLAIPLVVLLYILLSLPANVKSVA
ncbi:MAG: hypothetical protein RLZZ241_809 [Bacteroidota bacterium]|jgi:CDP-diacylglycerol--serine O-phosphatidyltransferase